MPEAGGHVVLKVDDKLSSMLKACDEWVSLDIIGLLLSSANLAPEEYLNKITTIVDAGMFMEMGLSDDLSLEDKTELKDGYTRLTIFGTEWFALSHVLINSGDGLEIYASIHDEYGSHYWSGRNDKGDIYERVLDEEGDEDEQEEALADADGWPSFLPSAVKLAYPDFHT